MSKKTYKVASEDGARIASAQVGDTVEVDLDRHAARAVVAAGWLELVDDEKPDEKPAEKPKEASK